MAALQEAGFLQRLAHPLAPVVTVRNGGLHQPGNRPRRRIANREGLDDVVALEHGAHAVEKLGRVDLGPVAMEKALDKHRHRHRTNEQDQP